MRTALLYVVAVGVLFVPAMLCGCTGTSNAGQTVVTAPAITLGDASEPNAMMSTLPAGGWDVTVVAEVGSVLEHPVVPVNSGPHVGGESGGSLPTSPVHLNVAAEQGVGSRAIPLPPPELSAPILLVGDGFGNSLVVTDEPRPLPGTGSASDPSATGPTPEPATWVLLTLTAGAAALAKKRRREQGE